VNWKDKYSLTKMRKTEDRREEVTWRRQSASRVQKEKTWYSKKEQAQQIALDKRILNARQEREV
jgi:hypothetical protein